jgi:hypothetical protein
VPFHILLYRRQRGCLSILRIIDPLHDVNVRPIVIGEVFEIREIVQTAMTEDDFGDQADKEEVIFWLTVVLGVRSSAFLVVGHDLANFVFVFSRTLSIYGLVDYVMHGHTVLVRERHLSESLRKMLGESRPIFLLDMIGELILQWKMI